MASHKIAAMLRAMGQLSEQQIEDMSEDEAWEWLRSNSMAPDNASDSNGTVWTIPEGGGRARSDRFKLR